MIQVDVTPEITEHVIANLRHEDREEAVGLREDGDYAAALRYSVALPGYRYAFCHDDGEPIVLGGFLTRDVPWVMESWLVATPRIRDIGVQLVKTARRMHRVLGSHGVRRIQTLCLMREGNGTEMTVRRWLGHLGYEQEGIMRQLGANGQDYAMMALIQP